MRNWLYSSRIVCRINRLHTGMSRVEMNGGWRPALDMPSECCYFVDKAAAADAAPALYYFGSILHCPAVFTQNLEQTQECRQPPECGCRHSVRVLSCRHRVGSQTKASGYPDTPYQHHKYAPSLQRANAANTHTVSDCWLLPSQRCCKQ